MKSFSVIVAVLSVLIIQLQKPYAEEAPATELSQINSLDVIYGQNINLEVIRNPERVLVYRMGAFVMSFDFITRRVHRSKVISGPHQVDKQYIKPLSEYFLDTHNFIDNEKHEFWYGVGGYDVMFRFIKGHESIDIPISFLGKNTTMFHVAVYRGDDLIGAGMAGGLLLDTVKKLFPKDQYIQDLR